jgi:hypothetical protein
VTIRPSGNVIGVSSRYHKLQVIKIAGEAADIGVALPAPDRGPLPTRSGPD